MEFTTRLELQSQTTRLVEGRSYTQARRRERGCHPPRRSVPGDLTRAPKADLTSPDYNSEDFQSELFPLHSQLLRESLLVSFPPLSYMLKFSGYSCLIGGPIGNSIGAHSLPTLNHQHWSLQMTRIRLSVTRTRKRTSRRPGHSS